jgi:hypothetical protein
MKFTVEHSCYQLVGGRWVAQFYLNHCEGATLHSLQCLDPRIELTFATEAEAKERNRHLVRNWRDAERPDAELFEM